MCKSKAIRGAVYVLTSRLQQQHDIWQDHKFHFRMARLISSPTVSGSLFSWLLSNISSLRYFSLLVVRLLSEKTCSYTSGKLVGARARAKSHCLEISLANTHGTKTTIRSCSSQRLHCKKDLMGHTRIFHNWTKFEIWNFLDTYKK